MTAETQQWTPVAPINDIIQQVYAQKTADSEAEKAARQRIVAAARQAPPLVFGNLWEAVAPYTQEVPLTGDSSACLSELIVSIPELNPFTVTVCRHDGSLDPYTFHIFVRAPNASWTGSVHQGRPAKDYTDEFAALFVQQKADFEKDAARKVQQKQMEERRKADRQERDAQYAAKKQAKAAETEAYKQEYRAYVLAYDATVKTNRTHLGEAVQEASRPFPAWKLTYAVVAADEYGDKSIEQESVIVLNPLASSKSGYRALLGYPRRIADVHYSHVVSIEALGDKQWSDFPLLARWIKISEAGQTLYFRPDDETEAKMGGLVAAAKAQCIPLPTPPLRPSHTDFMVGNEVEADVRKEIDGEMFLPGSGSFCED